MGREQTREKKIENEKNKGAKAGGGGVYEGESEAQGFGTDLVSFEYSVCL